MARTLRPEDLGNRAIRRDSASQPRRRSLRSRASSARRGRSMRSISASICAVSASTSTCSASPVRENLRHPLLRVGEGEGRPCATRSGYVFNFRDPEERSPFPWHPGRYGIPAGLRSWWTIFARDPEGVRLEGVRRQKDGSSRVQSRQKEIFGSLEEEAKSRGSTSAHDQRFFHRRVDDSGEPMTEEKFATLTT